MNADRRPGQGANYQPREPQVTNVQVEQMVGQSFNKLLEAIKTGDTTNLTNFLAFSSRFHRYSRNNQQCIYEQMPSATQVGSYKTWKEQGLQVRKLDKEKGERGIAILVPVPLAGQRRSERVKDLAEEEKQPKKLEWFPTTRFKIGYVFDIQHLTEESQARVPKFFSEIQGDHEAIYQRLLQVAQQDNIQVIETLNTYGAQGRSKMGVIEIRPDMSSGNKASTLAHEISHEAIHDENLRRKLPSQVKEAHAESTAYIIMQHFGVTIPYSHEYLKDWAVTPELLRQELDVITSAASKIISKIEAVSPNGQKTLEVE